MMHFVRLRANLLLPCLMSGTTPCTVNDEMQALTDFGGICLFRRIWVTSPLAVSRNKGEAACSDAAGVSAVGRDAGRAIRDDSAGAIRRHMESRPLRATRIGDSKGHVAITCRQLRLATRIAASSAAVLIERRFLALLWPVSMIGDSDSRWERRAAVRQHSPSESWSVCCSHFGRGS